MKKLICTTEGIWDFFVRDGFLMCYNPQKEVFEKIYECDENDVDTTIDERGIIYAMLQYSNNFYVSRYTGEWETECILESVSDKSYYKNITLICNNNWLNAFYILKHDNKKLLVHQIPGSKLSCEVIAESVDDIVYSVTKDEKRNIYIAYSKEKSISMRKFVWKNKLWTKEEYLNNATSEILNISIGVTEEYSLLYTYCCNEDKSYKVYVNGETLTSGLQKEVFPCIVQNKSEFSCIFEYYGKMLVSYLENGIWKKIKYLHCDNFTKQDRIKISGAKDFDENSSNFIVSYGCKNADSYNLVCSNSSSLTQYREKLKNPLCTGNVEEFAKVSKNENKNISEEIRSIRRAVEKDGSAQILIQIANRLSGVENVLSKVVDIVTEINGKIDREDIKERIEP